MTPDDLAAIRARDVAPIGEGAFWDHYQRALQDRRALLAEVKRLEAALATEEAEADEALRGHGICEENMDAEIARLQTEVDRLTASGPAQATAAWNWAIEDERARILAAVEGLRDRSRRAGSWGIEYGDDQFCAAVEAIVKGAK
jgi:hypothetical protein